jgi:hypothetical protein
MILYQNPIQCTAMVRLYKSCVGIHVRAQSYFQLIKNILISS